MRPCVPLKSEVTAFAFRKDGPETCASRNYRRGKQRKRPGTERRPSPDRHNRKRAKALPESKAAAPGLPVKLFSATSVEYCSSLSSHHGGQIGPRFFLFHRGYRRLPPNPLGDIAPS